MSFAEVVVNVPLTRSFTRVEEHQGPYRWLDQAFTYEIPPALHDQISPGQLVWVPFGPRRLQGIVLALAEATSLPQTRAVDELVDRRPFLSPLQIELARWMSRRYLHPLPECVWLLLPPGIEEKVETLYVLAQNPPAQNHLNETQTELLDRLRQRRKPAPIPPQLHGVAESLVRRGYLEKRTHIKPPKAKPRRIKSVRLTDGAGDHLPSGPPRLGRIVEFLRREGRSVWVSAVYAATGASSYDLHKLERAGIVRLESEEVMRDPLAGQVISPSSPPALTEEQARAWQAIRQGLDTASASTFLLHGVTGSGKTELYLRAIEHVVGQGRQALALVPEISLTPQAIRRFGARLGSRIGIIHSNLSYGERYDTWRRARDGHLDVVIGPRSALFAPLPQLGLIVIDEEFDPSYKQEVEEGVRLPPYHAREVALELARLHQAAVILGSATPDVETYFRARAGEFQLLELPQRVLAHDGSGPLRYQGLPPVELVDLRAELRAGNTSIFSRSLAEQIERTLASGEQAILFLNRRGSATAVLCRSCGQALRCPRCNNPFTVHQASGPGARELVCHHCGKQARIPRLCPNCSSPRIRPLGLGTEKLEQFVHQLFPQVRTLRWDRDVTRGKQAHEKILDAFAMREADILIGTQMIAKGLDLPYVTLVGVVNADLGLNLPDFRAGERTFQLLTQVAGRAGRSARGGRVIIQTYHPDHYAIAAAARHDYSGFYDREIRFRQEALYPPFRPLVRLLFSGKNEREAGEVSGRLAVALQDRIRREGFMDLELSGPAPAFFAKLRGQYRFHILLRGAKAHTLLAAYPLPPGWRVDVDPVNLL